MEYSKEQIAASETALAIDNPGACNVASVADAMREAAVAWLRAGHDTDSANRCAPVRLILNQIAYLVEGTALLESGEYAKVKGECRMIARQA